MLSRGQTLLLRWAAVLPWAVSLVHCQVLVEYVVVWQADLSGQSLVVA
jgi:hypothetical protein